MQINFFEEFPTTENLNKAKLIDFDSTIYLAAKSFEKFEEAKKQLHKTNPKLEAAYWPILEKSYWVSPFSYSYELKNLASTLRENHKGRRLKVLIDLELPVLNKALILRNLFSFFKNERAIRKIFRDADEFNIDILTAEYPLGKLLQKELEMLGISYPMGKYPHKKLTMLYSSMIKHEWILNRAKKFVIHQAGKYKGNFQVGLGVITTGTFGDEPVLPPEQLDKDLDFISRHGVKTAVIYRLGGLNKEYLAVIGKYL
jgi:hypothetical protein